MVERKLTDDANRKYWEQVDKAAKEVDNLPRWMKGAPDNASTKRSGDKPTSVAQPNKGKA